MTPAQSTATNRLSKRRSYRRLMYGFVGGGVIAGLGLRFLDYPLAGELAYWAGVLGFLAVWLGTSVELFDERDAALGLYDVPPEVSGALYGYVALFVVFGLAFVGVRART